MYPEDQYDDYDDGRDDYYEDDEWTDDYYDDYDDHYSDEEGYENYFWEPVLDDDDDEDWF